MFSLSGETRTTKTLLAIMMIFTFVISCIVVLSYNDYFLLGDLVKRNNDDVKYIHSARTILNIGVLPYNSGEDPSAFIMPGFPIILAGFMAVFGQESGGVIAFRIFHCLLQAMSIYFIFWIARRSFNTRVALIASALSCLYLPDYFSSGSILTETIFRTILLLMVMTTFMAIEKNKTSWYILLGVLTAAAAYFKPHATLYPGVFLILWWRNKIPWRTMLKYMLWMIGTYIALLAPWWIRNWLTFDKFILFTNSGGSPFLLGTRIHGQLPPAGFFLEHPEYDPETIFKGAGQDAVQKGKDIIAYGFKHEPLRYLYWFTIGRWVELYFHPFYSRPFWPVTRPVMNVIQIVLMVINMLGLTLALFHAKIRKSLDKMLPLLLALTYFTVIYIPFVAFNRYGYPQMWMLIIFGAYLISEIVSWLTNRRNYGKGKIN